MLGCALIGAASLTAAAMPATLESGRQAGLVVVTHGGVGVVVLVPIRARVAMLDYQGTVDLLSDVFVNLGAAFHDFNAPTSWHRQDWPPSPQPPSTS